MGSASGLFNMMRNLGGAVGIALLQTFVTMREPYHTDVMMHRFRCSTRRRGIASNN